MQRLLSIDPATHTGWAFYEEETERTTWGMEDFSGWDLFASRALRFSKWFTWVLTKEMQPTLISIEEPHPGLRNRKAAKHWISWCYVELQRIALAATEQGYDLHMEVLQPGEIKTFATGKGNASKEDVLLAIQDSMPGRDGIWSQDIADAVAQNDLMRHRHRIGQGFLLPYAERLQPRLAV